MHTPHDALLYTMIAMSAVDRRISDSELSRISEIVRNLPAFMGYDTINLAKAGDECSKILSEDDGLEKLLEVIADTVPKKLRETAYALAVEVAAADLKVPDEEIRFLELLRDALQLDKLVTAAIERSARARYQTL